MDMLVTSKICCDIQSEGHLMVCASSSCAYEVLHGLKFCET